MYFSNNNRNARGNDMKQIERPKQPQRMLCAVPRHGDNNYPLFFGIKQTKTGFTAFYRDNAGQWWESVTDGLYEVFEDICDHLDDWDMGDKLALQGMLLDGDGYNCELTHYELFNHGISKP